MALNDGGDALIEVLREALDALGGIQVRRMFGGHGLFQDGLMFALISDDVLYLKADATTQPDFEAEGMLPFTYERRDGKTTVMSYWRAPERLLDETDELQEWANRAMAVARRKAARQASRRGVGTIRPLKPQPKRRSPSRREP